jgi:hypothetical protein
VNPSETPAAPDTELSDLPADATPPLDAAEVMQSTDPGDGELDPAEHPEDPRAGYQR